MKHRTRVPVGTASRLGLALTATVLASSTPARADWVTATLAGSHIQRLSVAGYDVSAEDLMVGQSSGEVSTGVQPAFPTQAADDLDLQSAFSREGTASSSWTVNLGDWWDTNGAHPDFFVFELGGNDALMVAPIFPGGGVGSPVSVTGWTHTGYTAVTGAGAGQAAYGLAFGLDDLRDASGAPLAPDQHLAGVRMYSTTIDGAVFTAVATGGGPGFQLTDERAYLARPAHVWSPLELWFKNPFELSQLGVSPNPFTDLRLQVTFRGPSGQILVVPGFFAGDGRGGGFGSIWKARLTPDEAGPWTAIASFRAGPQIAIDLDPLAGQPTGFDGVTLDFQVKPVPPAATGFHQKGMLRYVGSSYLRFDDGDWFLKGGTNSPENLLAYFGFDGVADSGNKGILHRYGPHRADWKPGDPDWIGATTGEDGHGIIGALNFLSDQGLNALYMLPMNLGGDGQDVCPFVGQDDTDFDKTHYDVGRLRQWDIVFEHAQARGLMLHLVLAETEAPNENWLDDGGFALQRRLFFRELVARFGHHNAIKWNLCEENDWPVSTLQAYADYLDALDAYDHPIAVHNKLDDLSQFSAIAGDPRFTSISVQYSPDQAGNQVQTLRAMATSAGHAWPVDMDENGPPDTGLSPTNAQDLRKRVLWDVYFSGGAGIEWYFGTKPPPIGGDVDVEDFSTRQGMWAYMKTAREFMEKFLDFESMSGRDYLLSGESGAFGGGEVFSRAQHTYAVYLPDASPSGVLDLGEAAGISFTKRWFDPRANAFAGNSVTIQGGAPHALGAPPYSPDEDWVLLLKKL